jgi:outer membrane receptor for ferrienterochelin and colicin
MDNFDYKKYIAEGTLFEEDFKNPILDKYLKLKKSIDNKTVFDYELSDFINDLDNTERKGLESDLGLERDELYEGVIDNI